MTIPTEGRLIRIFIGESDRAPGWASGFSLQAPGFRLLASGLNHVQAIR
jgi:hypothetical protein